MGEAPWNLGFAEADRSAELGVEVDEARETKSWCVRSEYEADVTATDKSPTIAIVTVVSALQCICSEIFIVNVYIY